MHCLSGHNVFWHNGNFSARWTFFLQSVHFFGKVDIFFWQSGHFFSTMDTATKSNRSDTNEAGILGAYIMDEGMEMISLIA